MDRRERQRKKSALSICRPEIREESIQSVDKVLIVGKHQVVIFYTHRPPVSIWAEDAYSLYLYLQTPTNLNYTEFTRAVDAGLEETAA